MTYGERGKTPYREGLMADSTSTQPEQKAQSKFRIREAAALLLLLVSIGLFDRLLTLVPNREELGFRTAAIQFDPVALDPAAFGPFKLAGAWRVSSDDPRVGGVSALAADGGVLTALSDSGVFIRFPPPNGRIGRSEVGELPGGPGTGLFKHNRDSEALTRDPAGRGWWVAFENWNEVWLYSPNLESALERIELGVGRWGINKGVEGIAASDSDLLLFPESGDGILKLSGSGVRSLAVANAGGRISDAAVIGPGRYIAIERRLTPLGFANSLMFLERSKGGGYRFGKRVRLPLGPLDNLEAIAVDRRPDGGGRLWLMTDDNFQRPLRTLLIALDMPAGAGTAGN